MKITDVIIFEVRGTWPEATNLPRAVQVKPISLYPEFAPKQFAEETTDRSDMRALYVEIETDAGISGLFGPIQRQQAFIIDNDLRPFLIGRDPLATELLLDQMMRLHRHGRSGIFMTGVSPVDCALWDLKGKAWEKPIYRFKQYFHKPAYEPENGIVRLPDLPGLGLVLDEVKIEEKKRISF